jgi:hypothetical protein
MLIGVIVAVLLLAASLRRGRAAIVALVVAAVGSVVAIVIWSASQSPVRVAGGVIEVRSAALMQSDVWFCQAATRSTGMRTRARGLLHPLASPELLAQTGMTLVCERDGTPVEFQWGADVGMKMAFMSRRVEVSKNAATRTMSLAGSPLRFIAQEAYPGALLVAEERDSAPSGDVVERWPRIILTPATKRAGH